MNADQLGLYAGLVLLALLTAIGLVVVLALPIIALVNARNRRRIEKVAVARERHKDLLDSLAKEDLAFLTDGDPETWNPEAAGLSEPTCSVCGRVVSVNHWGRVKYHYVRGWRGWLAHEDACKGWLTKPGSMLEPCPVCTSRVGKDGVFPEHIDITNFWKPKCKGATPPPTIDSTRAIKPSRPAAPSARQPRPRSTREIESLTYRPAKTPPPAKEYNRCPSTLPPVPPSRSRPRRPSPGDAVPHIPVRSKEVKKQRPAPRAVKPEATMKCDDCGAKMTLQVNGSKRVWLHTGSCLP